MTRSIFLLISLQGCFASQDLGSRRGAIGPEDCGDDETFCGDFCANLETDPSSCGDCATACADGWACEAGVCVDPGVGCGVGLVRCADACVDVSTDEANCGACANACEVGSTCEAGACDAGGCEGDSHETGCECSPAEFPEPEVCYEGPAETLGIGDCRAGLRVCSDDAWGGCEGAVGPVDEECNGSDDDCDGDIDEGLGDCCPIGWVDCGAGCVDLETNSEHCGACGSSCGGGACVGGACE